ncbi:unnamed protein product [Phytomonas sp. EM1]|nr:unnamed protein product [Phytomonas sp. EM1]|eukprot:CCW62121.1 unnamed protein product [Phytomonas sp. isolate EM1]
MFRRSLICCQDLTEASVTHQLTNKNRRLPKIALQKMREERIRKRRRDRGRDLFAKEAHMKAAVASTTNARDLLTSRLADQIFSKGHMHTATATNITFVPDGNPAMPLVALAGREHAGKTSLLRSLFRSVAHVSRSNRQLRRDAINYFNVGSVFNVADLPGYGGTSVPWSILLQHAVLLRNFVRCQPSLKMLYYCMDVHYKNGVYIQDIDMLKFLSREVPNFTIVLTKADQINESNKATHTFRVQDIREELLFNEIHHPVIVTSAYKMGGIDTLRFDMVMNCLHAIPTERLTFAEAKKLSERLLSQKELSTVRNLPLTPTQLDNELCEWNKELLLETQSLLPVRTDEASDEVPKKLTNPLLLVDTYSKDSAAGQTTASTVDMTVLGSLPGDEKFPPSPGVIQERVATALLTTRADGCEAAIASSFPDDLVKQSAYKSLLKKVHNKELMRYVRQTSPWRNPLLWPKNVIPTKHPKSNLMRCVEDPENPYLFQPAFVAPRADMCFRRPNVGFRRSSQKGRYEADQPLVYLMKPFTIPYFPDIVDTAMHPQPWTFLGSREAFYERGGGRQLGVRLMQYARKGEINPLMDDPAPENLLLTQELRTEEKKRYGAPIAMLSPPPLEDSTNKPKHEFC